MPLSLPPGPSYLLRIVPYYAPSIFLSLGVHLLQEYKADPIIIPTRLLIVSAVVARPIFDFLSAYWRRFRNSRHAAAAGAIIPPSVKESTLSLLGRLDDSAKNGYPAEVVLDLAKTYGNTFQLDMSPLPTVVVTMEPNHVKAILATQFEAFPKGALFIETMDSLLGGGVFNADGEMWKFHRSMTRPFFVRERISDFDIYERTANSALALAKERLAEGISIDFQDLTARFTLDSAVEFLVGAKVDSIGAGLPFPPPLESRTPKSFYDHPSTPFVNAFGQAQALSIVRLNYGPIWRLMEFWKDEVKPLRATLDEFVTPLMNKALENQAQVFDSDVKSGGEQDNLLAHLVRNTQDPQVIKDELFNLLVAGRDTTSSLLTFSLYMLTQHPDIEARLREEIFKFVGPTATPDYGHMRDMKYMRAFLNEVLRMYPPVPTDGRRSIKDVVLPATSTGGRPIYIPAETTCIYATINMHRRKDLWGPDALKFDPDRFLDSRLQKYLVPNPFIFCPFNAGPRICLGQQFAYHEATYFLVRLLQQFTGFKLDESLNATPPPEWQHRDEAMQNERIWPMAHLTLYVKGGLWITMEELKRD